MMSEFENSAGSMQTEYERYMESVQAYSNKMKASIEELQITLLDSGVLKVFYSISTGVIDSISSLGKFNYTIAGVTLAMGGLTLANRKAMMSMKEFQVVSAIGGMNKLGTDIKTCTLSLLGFKTATEGAKVSATALNLATAGLTLGLPLLAMGVGAVVNHFKKAKEEAENFAKELDEFGDKSKNLDSLIKKQENLEKSMLGLDKTTTEYNKKAQELLDVRRQIAELMPSAKTGEDEYGNALATNTTLTKELVEQEKIRMAIKAKDSMDKMGSEGEMKILESELEGISKVRDVMMEIVTTTKGKELSTFFDPLANREVTLTADQIMKRLDGYNTVFDEGQEKIKKWNESAKLMNEIFGYSLPIFNTFDGSILKINNSYDNFNKNAEESKAIFVDYEGEMESLNNEYESISESLNFLTDITKEYAESNKFSAKSKEEIMKKFPELLGYMDDESKLYDILKQKQNEEKINQQKNINAKLMLNQEFYQRLLTMQDETFMNMAKAYNIDLNNYKSLAEAKLAIQRELNNKILDSMKAITRANALLFSDDPLEQEKMASAITTPIYNEIDKAKAELNGIKGAFDSITNKFSSSYSGLGVKDPIGTNDPKTKKETKEVQDLSLELDKNIKLKEKLDDIENKLKANETSNKDKISILTTENELLNEKVNIQKQLNNAYQNDKSGLKSSLSNNGVKFDLTGKISNGNEILKQRQDLANKMTGDTKEEAIKLVKKLQDDINSYNDLHLNLIPDIEIDIQSIKNNIKDNESELVKIFSDTLNEEINNVLSDSDSVMENINNKISLLGNIDESEKEEYLSYLQEMQKAYQNRYDIIGKSVDVLKDKLKTATKEEAEAIESQIKDLEKQSISVQIDMVANMDKFQSELDSILNEAKDKMKSEFEKLSESIIYGSKGKDGYNSYIDKEINKLDQVIKAYNEAEKWQKREEERKDRLAKKEQLLLDIQKEKDKLENLKKQKTHQVLTKQADGSYQYEYTYDLDAIEDQQDKIKDLNEQLTQWQEDWNEYQKNLEKELLMESLENQKKKLEEERKSKEQAYTQMNDTFKNKVDECKTIQDLAMLDINSIVNTGMSEITKTYGIKFNEISQSSKDSVMNMLKHQLAYQQSLQTTIALLTQMKALSGGGSVNTPNTSTSKSSGKIAGAYSGGMTPSWGSNGKMMMLHQDELILNALDSKVLLNIQDIVKQLSTVNIPKGLNVGVNDIIDKIVKIPQQNTKDEKPIQQNVTIQANFPNVTAQDEIRKAFDGIELTAIQYLKE